MTAFDPNVLLVGLGFDPLLVTVILGPLASVAIAAADVPSWTATKRRVIALVVALVVAIGVWAAGAYPASWEYLVTLASVALASMQTAFSILKPLGIIDWIGQVTPGGEPPSSRARHRGELAE